MFQGTKSACNIQHIPLEANTQYDNVATPALNSECEALTLQSLSPHPEMETVSDRMVCPHPTAYTWLWRYGKIRNAHNLLLQACPSPPTCRGWESTILYVSVSIKFKISIRKKKRLFDSKAPYTIWKARKLEWKRLFGKMDSQERVTLTCTGKFL